MARKKHIPAGFYVKTECGIYIAADTDNARWAHSPSERGICKRCEAVKTKQTRGLLESLMAWEPEAARPVPLSLDDSGGLVEGHRDSEDDPWGV